MHLLLAYMTLIVRRSSDETSDLALLIDGCAVGDTRVPRSVTGRNDSDAPTKLSWWPSVCVSERLVRLDTPVPPGNVIPKFGGTDHISVNVYYLGEPFLRQRRDIVALRSRPLCAREHRS